MEKPLTSYQKGIIKRYYENKDGIAVQKLGEVVSDLYLETDPKKAKRLWASAETALLNLGIKIDEARKIVAEKDLKSLAKKAEELF